MAEIGLIASVIGVAGAALTSSRALFELVDEVRNAPVELLAISKDVHSFHDVVGSVQMAIRDRLVIKALLRDKKLCELVLNLEAPLQNCSSILAQLRPRIQTHLKSTNDGKFRLSIYDVRWIFKKKDILDCRNRLEVTKSTLDAALTSVIFFCSLRSAGRDVDSVLSSNASSISRDLDAGSVLREYAESITPRSPPLDAVSMIDRIELLKQSINNLNQLEAEEVENIDPIEISAQLKNNPAEVDAEKVGSNDPIESPTQLKKNSTQLDAEAAGIIGRVGPLAQLNNNSAEFDAEAVRDPSSDLNSTAHRSPSGTSSGNPEATQQANRVLNPNKTSERPSPTNDGSLRPQPHSIAERFFKAITANNLNLIKALLQEGYDVNYVAGNGKTALHLATKWGREDVVRVLLANNANVNAENPKSTPSNMTPLHYAARYNHRSIVEILLDNRADTTAYDGTGDTAFGVSIRRDYDDTAIALMQRESTLINNVDNNALPPLHHAIYHNRPKIVEALIARGKQLGQLQAMLDARDQSSWTPLMLAIYKGSFEIASQLLALGADIEECDNAWKNTPLLWAGHFGDLEMMEFLIAQGADHQARSDDDKDYLQIFKQYHPEEHEKYITKGQVLNRFFYTLH